MDKGYYGRSGQGKNKNKPSQSTIKMDKGYYIMNSIKKVDVLGSRNPQ